MMLLVCVLTTPSGKLTLNFGNQDDYFSWLEVIVFQIVIVMEHELSCLWMYKNMFSSW